MARKTLKTIKKENETKIKVELPKLPEPIKPNKILCFECKYFNKICTHKSNQVIQIAKKVHKIKYVNNYKKCVCDFFEKV